MLPRTSRIVALCSAANFINAADRVIMPIAIVPMTDEFKWNLHWQGWILSAFAFGYFTSQVNIIIIPLLFMVVQQITNNLLNQIISRSLEQIQLIVLDVKLF
jgi:hypothetical protein